MGDNTQRERKNMLLSPAFICIYIFLEKIILDSMIKRWEINILQAP